MSVGAREMIPRLKKYDKVTVKYDNAVKEEGFANFRRRKMENERRMNHRGTVYSASRAEL